MHDDGQQQLGYRGHLTSRPKGLFAKTLSVVLGSAVLVSAFVVSIAFFAVGLAVLLAFGGYLWWKTRHLRRQLREQMQNGPGMQAFEMHEARRSDTPGDVIEGEVISRKETSDPSRL